MRSGKREKRYRIQAKMSSRNKKAKEFIHSGKKKKISPGEGKVKEGRRLVTRPREKTPAKCVRAGGTRGSACLSGCGFCKDWDEGRYPRCHGSGLRGKDPNLLENGDKGWGGSPHRLPHPVRSTGQEAKGSLRLGRSRLSAWREVAENDFRNSLKQEEEAWGRKKDPMGTELKRWGKAFEQKVARAHGVPLAASGKVFSQDFGSCPCAVLHKRKKSLLGQRRFPGTSSSKGLTKCSR